VHSAAAAAVLPLHCAVLDVLFVCFFCLFVGGVAGCCCRSATTFRCFCRKFLPSGSVDVGRLKTTAEEEEEEEKLAI
jgi:hypothetical protein